MIDQTPRRIAGKIPTRLYAQLPASAVQPGFEPVLPPVAQRLTHHRKIIGVAPRHRGKAGLDGGKSVLRRDEVGDQGLGDDQHIKAFRNF